MAVEIKRRGEIDGVEQLTRYLDLLNRDPLLAPVSGVFAAQQIKPQARTLAEDRGIRCVVLDYDGAAGSRRRRLPAVLSREGSPPTRPRDGSVRRSGVRRRRTGGARDRRRRCISLSGETAGRGHGEREKEVTGVDVKIGVTDTGRELVVTSTSSPEDVEAWWPSR